MKYIAVISARLASSRLPGKVLAKLWNNKSVLEILIDRLKLCKNLDKIIVGTTTEPEDKQIKEVCDLNNIGCYLVGNKDSGLDTVFKVSHILDNIGYNTLIVDITADCPLIDPYQIDEMIKFYEKHDYDYLSNCMIRSFPIGFDIQVYKGYLLYRVKNIIKNPIHRTHSGWNIWAYSAELQLKFINTIKYGNIIADQEYCYPDWRIVVDYPEDLELLKNIINHFNRIDFTYQEVIQYLKQNKDLLLINKDCKQKNASIDK